ncbi:hypothetical protein [Vibrio echinoideorum]|jgi:hypothetical protein|uniref:hypothetical protein n=1 Tax=Vibrio echinoideorum TaxID=2100116 RepID=UPI001080A8AB|nr:hypothetical protein [Vibrio echinoideorum]
MSNNNGQQPSAPMSIGGVSALLVGIANIWVPTEHIDIVTTAAPILVGFGFKFWTYKTANKPSVAELAATSAIDRQIEYLEERIKKAKDAQRDSEFIKKLEAKLSEQELARAAVFELSTSPSN